MVGPDDRLVPDLRGKLPGRGIWVSADRDLLQRAVDKKMFHKAARRKIDVDADLLEQVTGLQRRYVLELLGLSRRAGQAVTGFEKVRKALKSDRYRLLFGAADGAEDGRRKLQKLAAALPGQIELVEIFTVDELSLAFGHENVVHAAVKSGGLAGRIERETARLAGLK